MCVLPGIIPLEALAPLLTRGIFFLFVSLPPPFPFRLSFVGFRRRSTPSGGEESASGGGTTSGPVPVQTSPSRFVSIARSSLVVFRKLKTPPPSSGHSLPGASSLLRRSFYILNSSFVVSDDI